MDEMENMIPEDENENTGAEEDTSPRDDAGDDARDDAGDNAPVNGQSDSSPVQDDPEPGPTPEQEEEWERERKAAWEAKLKPYRELAEAVKEHDELMADVLYEVTLLEIGMEE